MNDIVYCPNRDPRDERMHDRDLREYNDFFDCRDVARRVSTAAQTLIPRSVLSSPRYILSPFSLILFVAYCPNRDLPGFPDDEKMENRAFSILHSLRVVIRRIAGW
jgi:hypothetical protein